MLAEWLILFVIITFICLILSIYTMEDNPFLAIPMVMVGMVFSVLCSYGVWAVDYIYVAYNNTVGNSSAYTYSVDYGDPYSYIFVLVFFIFVMLFIRCGWNLWQEALRTKGEMDYRNKRRRY